MAYLDNTGLGTLWGRIKTYIASYSPVTSVNGNTGDVTISAGDTNVIEGIKLDGESSSLTPSSKVVTIPSMGASGSNHRGGLVPDPGSTSGTTKYLREDGSWQIPPDTNTTYSASDFDIKDLTDSTSLMSTWSGKQDALVFNTAYDASSNKVATMSDIPDISTKQDVIDSSHKLSADLITDGTTNKVINVKPDWNAASGNDAEILNKPTISTITFRQW